MSFSNRQYIIEIDDQIFRYKNGRFNQIESSDDAKGSVWFITDFPSDMQQAISRVSTVETEPKYAGIMVGKKLQEEGEFTEPVHVINHSVIKKGSNRSQVFFTAVGANLFHHYQDRISDSQNTLLVFPLYRLLWRIIQKMKSKRPMALIFRHSRHADLVIATSKKVYYANRATTFDDSQDQVESLWNMIDNDINTVERDQKIQLGQCVICNWFDAPDLPEWADRKISSTPTTDVTIDCENKTCSLLPLLDLLHPSDSISPTLEKLTTTIKQLLPISQIIIFILGLGLLGGSALLQNKTAAIQQRIATVKEEIVALTNFSLAAQVDYQENLKLLSELNGYRQSKTFKIVINDLSTSLSRHMLVEQISADVQTNEMNIEIRGTINAGFQAAYQGYQNLLKNLKNNHYTIKKSDFNTEIDRAEFILTYSCKMGERL